MSHRPALPSLPNTVWVVAAPPSTPVADARQFPGHHGTTGTAPAHGRPAGGVVFGAVTLRRRRRLGRLDRVGRVRLALDARPTPAQAGAHDHH
jgi:hypothetical protein